MPDYFERRTRDDGTNYTTRRDDAPEWVAEVVQAAHDDEMPNDWRYATIAAIFEAIADGDTDSGEIADSLTDVYNANLTQWLAGNLGRAAYVDDASAEGLTAEPADLYSQIRTGQYYCIEQMASQILAAIAEHADELEDDA